MSTKITFEHEAQVKEETYSIGEFFAKDKELYTLVIIDQSTVALVCLNDGCRWFEGVKVARTSAITKEEMRRVTGGKQQFTRVSVEITTKPYMG